MFVWIKSIAVNAPQVRHLTCTPMTANMNTNIKLMNATLRTRGMAAMSEFTTNLRFGYLHTHGTDGDKRE